jgi:hypothetical protein
MPDLESRLPEMLRRTAAGASPDPNLERRVLRRSRRRRIVNASVAGLAAIAIVAGMVVGAEGLLRADRVTIGNENPTPSPTPSRGTVTLVMSLPGAVWPEVDQASLEAAQARADVGDLDWRLDPVETAAAFATEIFGWDPEDVRSRPLEAVPGPGDWVIVPVWNAGLEPGADAAGPPAPRTAIALGQLGVKGARGIWTVIGADSALIATDPLPASVRAGETTEVRAPASDVQSEWSGTLSLLSVDPAGLTPRIFPGDLTGMISGSVLVPDDALANIAVVARLADPEGTTIAADVVPISVVGGSPPPAGATGATGATGSEGPGGPANALPAAVSDTQVSLLNAASARDFDTLEALIDPTHFAYNFSDGSDPVPEWRRDPTPLDALATILEMPFTTTESTPLGTIYVWPSLVDADLTNLTQDERAMLGKLGITDKDVKDMLDAFGGYVGPRTGIAEDGTWVFFTTGGD